MYEISLSLREIDTLGWAAARGYFPGDVWDSLSLADGQSEDLGPNVQLVWTLEEHEAWPLLDAYNEEDFLSCIGGSLFSKVMRFTESIV